MCKRQLDIQHDTNPTNEQNRWNHMGRNHMICSVLTISNNIDLLKVIGKKEHCCMKGD